MGQKQFDPGVAQNKSWAWLAASVFLAHLINDVEHHSKDLGRNRQTSIIFSKPKPLVCVSTVSVLGSFGIHEWHNRFKNSNWKRPQPDLINPGSPRQKDPQQRPWARCTSSPELWEIMGVTNNTVQNWDVDVDDVEDHSKDLGRDRQTSIIFSSPNLWFVFLQCLF